MLRRSSVNATSLILYCVDDEYRRAHPDLLRIAEDKERTWLKALRIAGENGLLYYFSKQLIREDEHVPKKLLKSIIFQEERLMIRLKRTLHFVNSFFHDIGLEFMFIKLYRHIPYVPRDVDLLIRKEDGQRIVRELGRNNILVKTSSDVESQFEKPGLLKVDLYQGFVYFSQQFLDDECLWHDSRIVDICGINCRIPSREADMLSLLVHALFGHRYLSLLDFLYAKELLGLGISADRLSSLCECRKGNYAFMTMLATINNICQELYSTNTIRSVDFPFVLSPRYVLQAIQGCKDIDIGTRRKLSFIISTLFDSAFNKYQLINRYAAVEVPDRLKEFLMNGIYITRSWVGDHKSIAEPAG
jgi:hypothetical protein